MKRTFYQVLVTLGLISFTMACQGGMTGQNNSESPAPEETALRVNVASGCFNRYEQCVTGICLYGYDPCLCLSMPCQTNPNMPPLQWGAQNIGDQDIVIKRVSASFLDSDERVLSTQSCDLESISLSVGGILPVPIPSCSPPELGAPAGIDYQPSDIDFRRSFLRTTIDYVTADGAQKESSFTGPTQVFEED